MPGIIPDSINGGLQVRDADGNPISQPLVENGYNPPPSFDLTCTLNYLPTDCTARISAAQINAFQAEMLCLAATFDLSGTWNCDSTCNLASGLTNWIGNTLPGIVESTVCTQAAPVGSASTSHKMLACDGSGQLIGMTISSAAWRQAVGIAICASAAATAAASATKVITCDGAGNLQTMAANSAVLRNLLGLSLCASPLAGTVGTSAGLIGCDGAGSLIKFNPNSAPMRDFLGMALCGATSGTIDVDTRVIACNGLGQLVRVSPSDFATGAVPAATCEMPVTVLGRDGVAQDKTYPFSSIRGYAERTGNNNGGTWAWTAGLQQHLAPTAVLVNPSPCFNMKALIISSMSMAIDMSGDGDMTWNHYMIVNGVVDAPGMIAGQFQRAGESGTRYRTDYSTTRIREVIIPPGGSLSVAHRLDMNVATPFAAGGNTFSISVELVGTAL